MTNQNTTWEVWSARLAVLIYNRSGLTADQEYIDSFRDCYDAGDDVDATIDHEFSGD